MAKKRNRRAGPESGGAVAGPVAFDVGVGLAAALAVAGLPDPAQLVGLLSVSGVAVVCVVVGAALPVAFFRLHERAKGGEEVPAGYRGGLSLAIRLVGALSVLAMWFVMPINIERSGMVPGHFGEVLFVVGLLAIVAGALACFDSPGAALAVGIGAALVGLAFSLPADVSRWLEGTGRAPALGIALAAAAVPAIAFVSRYMGRLNEISDRLEGLLSRPRARSALRVAGPFLLGTALAWWNVLYAGVVASRLEGPLATVALVALGVVPYRLLGILAPPFRPLPLATGIVAIAATLAAALA